MKSFVALSALILAVCFAGSQCKPARNTNINTNTNTNDDFLSSYLNSMMDQERKGKTFAASRQQSGADSILCILCPLCCPKPIPTAAGKSAVEAKTLAFDKSPATAINQAQQEDQESADEIETRADDESFDADDASFEETLAFEVIPQQDDEISAIPAAQRKFF